MDINRFMSKRFVLAIATLVFLFAIFFTLVLFGYFKLVCDITEKIIVFAIGVFGGFTVAVSQDDKTKPVEVEPKKEETQDGPKPAALK